VWFLHPLPGWDGIRGNLDSSSRWATVATDVLNVRAAPGTESDVIGALVEGDSVEVTGPAEQGFVPVRYGDNRGWMAQEYLTTDGITMAVTSNPLQVADVSAAEPDELPVEDPAPEPAANQESSAGPPELSEPAVEPEPTASDPDVAGSSERWIDIDRTTATVTLYDGATPLHSFSGRIGRDPSSDGFYATAVGTFHVYSMNKGLAPTPFAEDTWLTDWVGFDPERKNGIHSPVRDAFGVEKDWQNPATLGCVRLSATAAVTVFEFAEIGMRVEVHD
jgi:hypothetical protein